MTHDLDAMADGLVLETLADTAQTFFGARRALEREIEVFQTRLGRLAERERTVRLRAGLLHRLLLDPDTARSFYARLGVDAADFVDAVDPEYRNGQFKPPFAPTAKGRYVKAVAKAYALAWEAMDEYLHGRYRNDPDGSGRKIMTANYDLLGQWCGRINQRIHNLNSNMSPSGTMCFVRGLDPGQEARERVTGGTIEGRAQGLDADLAFRPLPCMVMDQRVFPDLPPLFEVRGAVRRCGREIYAARSDEARQALQDVVGT